jgi:hypothetical protein
MLKKILNWLKRPRNSKQNASIVVESILYKLTITDEQEISCDEVHELIDQFSELKVEGEDVATLMPLMQKHLDLCPDCREEHDVLMKAIAYEKALDHHIE